MAELCVAMEGLADVLATRDDIHAKEMLECLSREFNGLFSSSEKEALTEEESVAAETYQVHDEQSKACEEEKGGVTAPADAAETPVAAAVAVDIREEEYAPETEEPTPADEVIDTVESGDDVESRDDVPEAVEPSVADSERPAEQDREFRPYDLRVDEMLSRREARQLRKAFTLNDKFKFRRELFDNDNVLFGETIDMIEAMKDIDEAVVYVRDDLGWDMDNEYVKDFMAVVANHFAEV